jgi:DNA polymerase I-like protein with 3'-5' exonuclease and polymerase domains
LSLIYGTGPDKLRNAIKTMSGTDIGEETSKAMVDVYRRTYSGVKNIWGVGGRCLEAISTGRSTTIGYEDFAVADTAGIKLPSGLYLQYPDLKKTMVNDKPQWDYAIRGGRDRIYGAKVFQGLTQATARCVMAEQMLNIQKRYPIQLTVHDALYLIVPEQEAEEALEFVLSSMRVAPDWLAGCPLDAEGGFGKTLADC